MKKQNISFPIEFHLVVSISIILKQTLEEDLV
jgi:hypothetical protein